MSQWSSPSFMNAHRWVPPWTMPVAAAQTVKSAKPELRKICDILAGMTSGSTNQRHLLWNIDENRSFNVRPSLAGCVFRLTFGLPKVEERRWWTPAMLFDAGAAWSYFPARSNARFDFLSDQIFDPGFGMEIRRRAIGSIRRTDPDPEIHIASPRRRSSSSPDRSIHLPKAINA